MASIFMNDWIALNPFRFTADISHVIATLVLLLKFWRTGSADGISGKTQFLFCMVYFMRYADLWAVGKVISVYNSLMKFYFIFVSFISVILVYSKFSKTYNREADSFRMEFIILPVTVLAFFFNYENTYLEYAWTWSIYMEAVALIPQLYMIWKTGKPESYILPYLFFLGMYRGMYIANWAYRYQYENYFDPISFASGVIESFVAVFGLLCVISLKLSNMKDTFVNESRSNKSVYVIPLIPGDICGDANELKKSKAMKHNTHLPL